jgi:hypothetical protein
VVCPIDLNGDHVESFLVGLAGNDLRNRLDRNKLYAVSNQITVVEDWVFFVLLLIGFLE